MLNDFKKFLMQGNVLDLAVAVVIGAAFKAVVDSFVSNILMPIVGAIFGQPSVGTISITLRTFDKPVVINGVKYESAVLEIGKFIDVMINFVIIAAAIFVVVKAFEAMQARRQAAPEEEAEVSDEVALLREIRDSLQNRG
ncbi:MAG: large conductance mechanosensitive channel protein MscL [Acidimicrobiales bacterium]|nr:large conductance mechanosensitive channel protein MscL [Acidimicrobiales bacterium]